MRSKRQLLWMVLWFLVMVSLMVWYMMGGPVVFVPIAFAVILVSLAPLMLKATMLQRTAYAVIWVGAGWFIWQSLR